MQWLETTSNVHAREGVLEAGGCDQGGDVAVRRGNTAITRSSIGVRCVLGDVLDVDGHGIGLIRTMMRRMRHGVDGA